MGAIRTTIKICLPAIVIGAGGISLGKCANECTYEMAKYELKLTRPTCKKARKRVLEMKDSDENLLLKYIKGQYGEIEAYKDYIDRKCQ